MADPRADWSSGQLRSARFDDVYASGDGALAQSRAVFLAGCGLPDRWQGRRRFTIAELGFGTGLNMLAVLQLWARTRPPGSTLHLFSAEAYPLRVEDAAAVHRAFADLAGLADDMRSQWPRGARGAHRLEWPGLGATLDLVIGDALEAVAGWDGKADAWFLDGFSPAKNPDMWSAGLLVSVAAHSAPGARAATWSVAAAVRQGLEAAGFTVSREPGFGHKRERLEAYLPGNQTATLPIPRIAIVGAGIAGAALARAARALGAEPQHFALGPMASGNPAALVSPRLAAGSASAASLHAWAFRRSVDLIRRTAPGSIIATGALRLLRSKVDMDRGRRTREGGLFDTDTLSPADEGLWVADALVVDPDTLRAAWLGPVDPRQVASLERVPEGWALLSASGDPLAIADIVFVAAGFGTAALAGLKLRPVRGQVTLANLSLPGPPIAWGGYAIPTRTGVLVGATHDRDDADPAPRQADHQRNLEALARIKPALAADLAGQPLGAAAGVRATTGDHQPHAGAIAPGLFVLTGLGGRGFTLAPLLAEHVAAQALGTPSPLTLAMQRLVDPSR